MVEEEVVVGRRIRWISAKNQMFYRKPSTITNTQWRAHKQVVNNELITCIVS